MSYDVSLLSIMKDKKNFLRFIPYVKEYAVSKEVWVLLKAIKEFYNTYPSKTSFDWPELKMFFFMLHAKAKESVRITYDKIFLDIDEYEKKGAPSSSVLDDVMHHFVKQDFTTQVFNKAHKILTANDATLDDIEKLVHDYRSEVGTTISRKDLFVSTDLTAVTARCATPGYNWRLAELNYSLGPLRDGDFIIIAARPETGKTTLAASEVSYFAPQLKDSRPIVWVNNEEASMKVMHRVIQSYFGITNEELMRNLPVYAETYAKYIGERILIINDESGLNNVQQLTALFADISPAMIVFDQLDKVEGFSKSEREDIRIGKLYEWGRTLAKKYGPVIAISQVDGTGVGQEWIYMNQLRGSKTDKIGEADAIITVGKRNDPTKEYNRYIHVPKNKLYGGGVSDESSRHGYFEVKINPSIARYEGVMK